VTITGTNFAEATVATFGGTEAANVTLQCDHDHRDGTGGHGTKAYEQNTQQSPLGASLGELAALSRFAICGGCAPCWRAGGTIAPSGNVRERNCSLPLTRESSIFWCGRGPCGLLTPSVVTTASWISAHTSSKR
jgi:hypothetical protein